LFIRILLARRERWVPNFTEWPGDEGAAEGGRAPARDMGILRVL
jgi:hypothetical protein